MFCARSQFRQTVQEESVRERHIDKEQRTQPVSYLRKANQFNVFHYCLKMETYMRTINFNLVDNSLKNALKASFGYMTYFMTLIKKSQLTCPMVHFNLFSKRKGSKRAKLFIWDVLSWFLFPLEVKDIGTATVPNQSNMKYMLLVAHQPILSEWMAACCVKLPSHCSLLR